MKTKQKILYPSLELRPLWFSVCLCNTAFINLTHMKPQMYFLSLSLILIKCPKKLRGTNYMITFTDIFSY